ncbi:MAG: hypothetical protein K0S26_2050 [Bacteroidota bacterium]|jgi:hypothetical protein|nr:hypothetical protein [Bacteroidota bacterium]
MKTTIFTCFFLVLKLSFCFAADQTLAEKLQMAKQRPLLVELPSMDEKYIEKLNAKGKNEELIEYTSRYNTFINNYKKAFTGYWTYNKEISFKTADEMAAIISQNTGKYAVIRYQSFTYGSFLRGLKHDPRFSNYLYREDNSSSLISDRKNFYNYTVLNLYLSEEQDLVLTFRLPVTESEGGIVYSLRQFEFTFDLLEKHPERKGAEIYGHNYYQSELNVPKIKTSVVYLRKQDLDKGFKEEKLAKLYKYQYKIVSNEEWESAVLEKKDNVICAILLPGNENTLKYYHMFFCASDGKMVTNVPSNFGFSEDDFDLLSKLAK